jgi:signal transduction histidine kinase
LRRKDGSKVNATVSARYAELLPGKCIEAVIRDLTERKQMERQIDEAKSESEFLNDLLSHDIMNFTFSALHFMNGLWKSPRISDDDRRDLAMAMKDIQGAYELTSSVRDLSRIRHIDKDELIIKDLRHLLAEASEETKRLFPDRNVSINFEKGVDPRYVTCTPLAVRLFTNILTNAVKYDPKQEVVVDIEVESLVKDGQVYWKVKMADTGRGIPDAEKGRIFERFHRLDQSVSGTGLGLYVAKFIAEAGGGKIWAENRVEGDHTKGTVIVVLMRKVDERDIALMTRRP